MPRLLPLLLASLLSACAAARASSAPGALMPVSFDDSREPVRFVRPAPGEVLPPLDDAGQRELLAGFELELGDALADRDRARAEARFATDAARAAQAAAVRSAIWPWVVGIGAGLVGTAVGLGLGYAFGSGRVVVSP